MTPIDTEYKRLCALRDAATPRPWKAEAYTDHDGPPECDELVVSADVGELIAPIADTWPLHWGERSTSKEQGSANAAFIAAAHDAMKLCDRLMAERKECAQYLKDGQSLSERIAQDFLDTDGLLTLLRKEKERTKEFGDALQWARHWIRFGGAPLGWSIERIDTILAKLENGS